MLTSKQIGTKIKSIGRAATKLSDSIHEVACNVIGHAVDHGDVTLATSLIGALGTGVRNQALVTYLEKVGPFRYTKDKDTGAHKFSLNKDKRAEMAQEHSGSAWVDLLMVDVKWCDYVKESVKSIYDVEALVFGILKSAQSKVDKGETVKNAALISLLSETIKSYKAVNTPLVGEIGTAVTPPAPELALAA